MAKKEDEDKSFEDKKEVKPKATMSSDSVGEEPKKSAVKTAKKDKAIASSAKKIVKIAKSLEAEDKYKGDIADQYDAEFELESKKD